MVLATFDVPIPTVKAEPITISNFKQFGQIISANDQLDNAIDANYGTALKIRNVTNIINNYPTASSTAVSVFRSSPTKTSTFKVLERHPYTTQSFIPMGQPLIRSYLIIVALSDLSTTLPIPSSIKAFTVNGNQAVTYSPGTWHAPMIVIDQSVQFIDFTVIQYENSIPNDDCQECYFSSGFTIDYENTKAKL